MVYPKIFQDDIFFTQEYSHVAFLDLQEYLKLWQALPFQGQLKISKIMTQILTDLADF